MGDDETKRVISFHLEPNVWTSRVLFPFLSGVLVLLGLPAIVVVVMQKAEIEVGLIALWFSRPVPGVMLPIVVLTTGLLYLGIRRKVAGPTLACRLDEEAISILHKNQIVLSSPVSEIRLKKGNFTVTSRYARGEQPVLELRFPPDKADLRVGVRDRECFYYWRGDDPYKRNYRESESLREPTHFVPGWAWVKLMEHIGLGAEVIGTRL